MKTVSTSEMILQVAKPRCCKNCAWRGKRTISSARTYSSTTQTSLPNYPGIFKTMKKKTPTKQQQTNMATLCASSTLNRTPNYPPVSAALSSADTSEQTKSIKSDSSETSTSLPSGPAPTPTSLSASSKVTTKGLCLYPVPVSQRWNHRECGSAP